MLVLLPQAVPSPQHRDLFSQHKVVKRQLLQSVPQPQHSLNLWEVSLPPAAREARVKPILILVVVEVGLLALMGMVFQARMPRVTAQEEQVALATRHLAARAGQEEVAVKILVIRNLEAPA